MTRLIVSLVCGLAVLSSVRAQDGNTVDGNPGLAACAAALCPVGTNCEETPDGKANCVPIDYGEGNAGITSVGDGTPDDPCIATTCLVGTFCVNEGGQALCITNCATVKCREGYMCETDENGNAQCVENDAAPKEDPCLYTTCLEGTTCITQPDGQAACVTPPPDACPGVECGGNQACVTQMDGKAQCIDVQTLETVACNLMCVMGKKCVIKSGKPTCVRDASYNPCAATTCAFSYDCVPKGTTAECVPACARKKCSAGKSCVLDKKGRPTCSSAKPQCKRVCPKGSKCGWKNGLPRCVSACQDVVCPRRKPKCMVDGNGKPKCVKRGSRGLL